jgi:hypothetical protein
MIKTLFLLIVIDGNLSGLQPWRHFLSVVVGTPAGHHASVVAKSFGLKDKVENVFIFVSLGSGKVQRHST